MVQSFLSGINYVGAENQTRRPSTNDYERAISNMHNVINCDRRLTIREVGAKYDIRKTATRRILT